MSRQQQSNQFSTPTICTGVTARKWLGCFIGVVAMLSGLRLRRSRKIKSSRVDVYVVDVEASETRLLWTNLTSREFRMRFKLWDTVGTQAFLLAYPAGITPRLTNLI